MMKPYYEDSGITIYNGDCFDVMPDLPVADCVITDPPFSAYVHKNAKFLRNKKIVTAIDFKAIDFKAIEQLLSTIHCKRWFIAFMDWRHIAELNKSCPAPWNFIRFGVWLKTNPMPQLSGDRPAHGWGGIVYLHNSNSKRYWNGGGHHGNYIHSIVSDGNHPTGKPLKILMAMIISFSEPGDLILDPFMGSGTTLVAAKQLNRKAIGIELNKEYCDIAVSRLRQNVLNFD